MGTKHEIGIITEIIGINELKYCNSLKYVSDEPHASTVKGYKFAEVRFIDKDKKQDKLEFFHYPYNGNWTVEHNKKTIGDAITWPVSYSERDLPLSVAAFCTEMFEYDFTISKQLKKVGAKITNSLANGYNYITDRNQRYDAYRQNKINKFKSDMNK